MTYTLKKMDNAKRSANEYKQSNSFESLSEHPSFKNFASQKAEYSLWGWSYNELSNLKIEISRVGLLVRLNNSASPDYLNVYHSHLYSLLLPLSTIIEDKIWNKIDDMWHRLEVDIVEFDRRRRVVRNLKVPRNLIEKLDTLYRISLLMMQKAGLGISMTTDIDISTAIEDSIVGS